MILIVIMTKTVTTKIDDSTYEKLIEKCTSSKENKCQYLKRMIENNLSDKNISNSKEGKKSISDKQLGLTLQSDGTWQTSEGVIIEESDERFEKAVRVKVR